MRMHAERVWKNKKLQRNYPINLLLGILWNTFEMWARGFGFQENVRYMERIVFVLYALCIIKMLQLSQK